MFINGYAVYSNITQVAGLLNCYTRVAGETRKMGVVKSNVKVVLCDQNGVYQRSVRSDRDARYSFTGCAKNTQYTIIAFDPERDFNAVIQANVVAK
ncbi:hypothetical protein QUG64_06555 [Acinetobacter lwoffii]|uniref:Carboxypeptidase regulatory-like domain-containing protein n=1 Tax=Acinetobacter lwoffii NCTC 5866 = CIP 64.10 = NIPH 512 TaxID=981327 RepID=A0ABN0PYS7_ACILW|nr:MULTISPECIES: hypothetical protein [Acinetobacter]ENU16292.1 hypothetical protein F995_01768 [Acinetobacter sp. CIP A162]ESJ95649.1 hypothetical protein P800_00463 [Acinetobacter lwoffii NCTC 5866 = CIP 64.10 = NIPH 512]QXB40803.1 hypothetical protein I6L23_01810 [Acinetobacter lwoffii]SUU31496.1 Uncharacterised protein [Acinetobacter lwoffii]VFQ37686.1 Uncharacterised protein [Acinetobacter lwoffii]